MLAHTIPGKTQNAPTIGETGDLRAQKGTAVRVLLVEDDRDSAACTALVLTSAGAAVDAVDTGEEALELLQHYDYDIVVLDVLLPDMEGYEVLRGMRSHKIAIPVLVLSGLISPPAKVKALGLGADDFINKPIDGAELVARVHAIVRRNNGFSQQVLRVGELELNQDSREVTVAGARVELSAKEYGTLELLLLRQGRAVRKEAFLGHLYGGLNEPGARIIDVFVCHLRRKLAQLGIEDLITTVTGYGYMIRPRRSEPALPSRSANMARSPGALDDVVPAA
jgi:two-component system cell cycle response regulator CtrA